MEPMLPAEEIEEVNRRLEGRPAEEALGWLLGEPRLPEIALASAFQAEGTCVIHMATRMRGDIPILFLETGFHFAETLGFKERLAEQLGLNVVELEGDYSNDEQAETFGERLYERDPAACCEINKVVPFTRALHGYDAWISSLRRDSSPTRAGTPIVEQYRLTPERWIVKLNPIAEWNKQQVWGYIRDNRLPHNPLYDLGFASIGCAPCTRAVRDGEGGRAGRWDGSQKLECGIHVTESANQAGAAR